MVWWRVCGVGYYVCGWQEHTQKITSTAIDEVVVGDDSEEKEEGWKKKREGGSTRGANLKIQLRSSSSFSFSGAFLSVSGKTFIRMRLRKMRGMLL